MSGGRTLSTGARGAKQTTPHGPLQRFVRCHLGTWPIAGAVFAAGAACTCAPHRSRSLASAARDYALPQSAGAYETDNLGTAAARPGKGELLIFQPRR